MSSGNSQSCLDIATKDFNGKHCMNLGIFDLDAFDQKNAGIDEAKIKGIQ